MRFAGFAFVVLAATVSAQTPDTVPRASPPVVPVVNGVPNPVAAVFNHLSLGIVGVGDTITPKFTITTDTVLKVVGTRIIARSCGVGHFFVRLWITDPVTKVQRVVSADTVAIPTCAAGWTAAGGDWSSATKPVFRSDLCTTSGALRQSQFRNDSLVVVDTAKTIPVCPP